MTTRQLGDFALLWGLSTPQREVIAALARGVEFAAGERIFDAGQEAHRCWLISSGQVAVDTTVAGRGEVVIQTLGAGDVLGWSWLLPPRRWHFGAVAIEPVTAIELDAGQLHGAMEDDPDLGYRVLFGLFGSVVERLQNTRARLLDVYGSPRGTTGGRSADAPLSRGESG